MIGDVRREFEGERRVRRMPLIGEKVRIFARADKQAKRTKKLQNVKFLKSEMVRKSAILGQTK